MTIGTRIKTLRISAGMTMDALGEMFRTGEKPDGLTKQAVSAWEKNRNQLTADQILRMCEIFNVSVGWLMTGAEERPGAKATSDEDVARNLDYLTDKEKEIVTAYRETDEAHKTIFESAAEEAPRTRLRTSFSVVNNKL